MPNHANKVGAYILMRDAARATGNKRAEYLATHAISGHVWARRKCDAAIALSAQILGAPEAAQ